MANPAHQPASKGSVRSYLLAAYEVTPDEVETAIVKPAHAGRISNDYMMRSHAYFPGDAIAQAEGWTANDQYDIDEDDDEDEF